MSSWNTQRKQCGTTQQPADNMSEPKETPLDAMVAGLNMLYDAMENPPQPADEEEETETKENKWIH